MEEKQLSEKEEQIISPRYVINLIMPGIKDELIAKCRFDRGGIRIKFSNGQVFQLNVTEIK